MIDQTERTAVRLHGAKTRGIRAWLTPLAFWLWAGVSFALATSLMVAHTYALPQPARDDRVLQATVARTRELVDGKRWRALHVLYSQCRCSQRILTQLFARGPRSDVSEHLVLVSAHAQYEQAARSAGFALEVISPEQLTARYGMLAAPLFVLADSEDRLRYVGGYTERKQGLAMRDVQIMNELRAGRDAEALPLFGCAVSDSLRRMLDPLGIGPTSDRARP
jgi:hypothetical protein